MKPADKSAIEAIQKLADRCESLIQETYKTQTQLSRARRYEFRNLRSVLVGILDFPKTFPIEKIKELFEGTRRRVQHLIDNPDSAGHHDHVLREWERQSGE